MGINKTPDGRENVGLGYSNLNEYKGYAGRREIVIQLTADGATQDSLDALDFLKSYALYHNSVGEPIFPASTNVFISNNGVTKAVEADEVTVDGANVNIGGCAWNGASWDFTNAGQGSGGGGSSGGGVLVVGITYDSQTDLYSCNKTAGEIWSAYAAGSNVVFSDTEFDDVSSLVYAYIDSGSYNFYACGYDVTTARFIFAANSPTDNPVQAQPD